MQRINDRGRTHYIETDETVDSLEELQKQVEDMGFAITAFSCRRKPEQGMKVTFTVSVSKNSDCLKLSDLLNGNSHILEVKV